VRLIGPDEGKYTITLESHVFELKAVEEGTTVELTANATPHGIRGRIIAALFWPGHQKSGLKDALDSISGIFEPEDDESEDISPPAALTD
jgi:hypothetical protein